MRECRAQAEGGGRRGAADPECQLADTGQPVIAPRGGKMQVITHTRVTLLAVISHAEIKRLDRRVSQLAVPPPGDRFRKRSEVVNHDRLGGYVRPRNRLSRRSRTRLAVSLTCGIWRTRATGREVQATSLAALSPGDGQVNR